MRKERQWEGVATRGNENSVCMMRGGRKIIMYVNENSNKEKEQGRRRGREILWKWAEKGNVSVIILGGRENILPIQCYYTYYLHTCLPHACLWPEAGKGKGERKRRRRKIEAISATERQAVGRKGRRGEEGGGYLKAWNDENKMFLEAQQWNMEEYGEENYIQACLKGGKACVSWREGGEDMLYVGKERLSSDRGHVLMSQAGRQASCLSVKTFSRKTSEGREENFNVMSHTAYTPNLSDNLVLVGTGFLVCTCSPLLPAYPV